MTRSFSSTLPAAVKRTVFALAALLMLPAWAEAQGVLININENEQIILPRPIPWPPHRWPHPNPQPTPVPQDTYRMKSLEVNVGCSEQVAKVQVSQSFVNTGSRLMEVCFVFPLPYDGAIDQFTLLIDGKEVPAKLLPASEAADVYEEIVRKNRDPALLEWMGTGMFKTSVFPVPPGAERKVTLRYTQLCRKTDGLTDFLFPLSTAKYTSHAGRGSQVPRRHRQRAADIKNVYSPNASDRNQAARRQACDRLATRRRNEIPTSRFPAVLRRRQRPGRGQRAQLPARRATKMAISCCWPVPKSKPADDGPAKEDGRVRRSIARAA